MSEEKKAPEKLEFGVNVFGHSLPVWHYTFVPQGMRPATMKDLYSGNAVLYKVHIGPDAGDYYTDYVRESTREPLTEMIKAGWPVYVKDSNNNR